MCGIVREAHPDILEGSGDSPGLSWRGREAHRDVRKWSGGPTGHPGRVERPTQT